MNGRGAKRRTVRSGPVRRERRQHGVHARAVGETRVDGGLGIVEPPPGARRQADAGVAQRLGVLKARRHALELAATLDPDRVRRVHEHLVDVRVGEQRRERISRRAGRGTRRRRAAARVRSQTLTPRPL